MVLFFFLAAACLVTAPTFAQRLREPPESGPNQANAVFSFESEPLYLKRPLPDEQWQQQLDPTRQGLHKRGGIISLVLSPQNYELIQISTPKGKSPSNKYEIDSSGGAGISVYILDRDTRISHNQFQKGFPRTIREIKVRDKYAKDDSPNYHGTCMASKAVGTTYGAAPKADLVAVQAPNDGVTAYIASLKAVLKDVRKKKLQGKAVLVSGWSVNITITSKKQVTKFRELLQDLVALDVVLVFASGNLAPDEPGISEYPMLLANELPIINVGAVNSIGERPWWSQGGPLLTTSAGGTNIICAINDGPDAYKYTQGTSFAAPIVAGVIAYWLGHPIMKQAFPTGQVAKAVKRSIKKLHWARSPGGNPVVYNGVHECLAPIRNNNQPRADVDDGPSLADLIMDSCTTPPLPTTTYATVTEMGPPPPPPTTIPPPAKPSYCYEYDQNCDGWCCPDEPGAGCSTLNPGLAGCTCGPIEEGEGQCSWVTFY